MVKKQETKIVQKSQKINNYIAQETKRLNQIKDDYVNKAEELQDDFNNFAGNIKIKRVELQSEVDKLEKRRQEALEPLDAELFMIKEEKSSLDIEKKKVLQFKSDNQSILDTTNRKLNEIKQEKKKLSQRIILLSEKQTDLDVISAATMLGVKNLAADKAEFDIFLKQQIATLNDKDINIKLREEQIEMDKKIINEKKKKIIQDKKKLKSQQQTLKLAFDEARSKNLL